MQTETKIDLQYGGSPSPQEAVGVVDFVQSYNLRRLMKMISDEFKESVKEPMTRVFEKKGLGMTDEQFLLVMFGKDIITKTATTLALKKQLARTLELVHEQYKETGSPPPPPPVQTPPTAPRAENSAPENRRERRKKAKKATRQKL